MPEGLNMGTSVPGGNRDHRDRIRKPFEKPLTLKVIINWIRQQNWDEEMKKELVKRVSAYPNSGLRYFANNINQQVTKISEERTKLRKEKHEREMQLRVQLSEGETSEGMHTGEEKEKEGVGNAHSDTITD